MVLWKIIDILFTQMYGYCGESGREARPFRSRTERGQMRALEDMIYKIIISRLHRSLCATGG